MPELATLEAVTAGDALDPLQAAAQRNAFRARLYDAPPAEE